MLETQAEFESQFGVPRCLRCAYVLENLPTSRCPECGTPFDFDDPDTYTLRPRFVRWKFWLPALATALVGGTAPFLVVLRFGGFGMAATLVLPACVGALIGYACRVRLFLTVAVAAVIAACTGLVTVRLLGLLLGLVLAGVAAGPLLLGTLAGVGLRAALKRSRFDQRWHLPLVAFLLLPPGAL